MAEHEYGVGFERTLAGAEIRVFFEWKSLKYTRQRYTNAIFGISVQKLVKKHYFFRFLKYLNFGWKLIQKVYIRSADMRAREKLTSDLDSPRPNTPSPQFSKESETENFSAKKNEKAIVRRFSRFSTIPKKSRWQWFSTNSRWLNTNTVLVLSVRSQEPRYECFLSENHWNTHVSVIRMRYSESACKN